MNRFEHRIALVTGAASGIGRAIALALAAEGAEVHVADLDAAGATAVAAACDRGRALTLDVADAEACRAAVAEVEQRSGRLDLLINNAGLQHVAPTHEFPEERWDRLIAVILSGPFHLIKAALPGMYERRFGRILNITSMLGLYGARIQAGFDATARALKERAERRG